MQDEFQERISNLLTEFCRKSSASERSVPTVTLPSKATQGQEQWSVISRGAKRRKVFLRKPCLADRRNVFNPLAEEDSVPATVEDKGRNEGADEGSLPKVKCLFLGIVKLQ